MYKSFTDDKLDTVVNHLNLNLISKNNIIYFGNDNGIWIVVYNEGLNDVLFSTDNTESVCEKCGKSFKDGSKTRSAYDIQLCKECLDNLRHAYNVQEDCKNE